MTKFYQKLRLHLLMNARALDCGAKLLIELLRSINLISCRFEIKRMHVYRMHLSDFCLAINFSSFFSPNRLQFYCFFC